MFSRSVSAEEHGGQRLKPGYDLNALVREYDLLRDCILQRLEEENAAPSLQRIEDLLDVSRILAGKLRFEVEAVEVEAVVEAALEKVRPAADAKGTRSHATLPSLATVMGDPHRLQQIAWNLLSDRRHREGEPLEVIASLSRRR